MDLTTKVEGPARHGHLGENTVAELLDGAVPQELLRTIEEHLESCEACRKLVSGAANLSRDSRTPDAATATAQKAAQARAERGQIAVPLDGPVTLESPGRYALQGEHARGGQSIIWRVFDTHVGREVALKRLRPPGPPRTAAGSAPTDTSVQRFLREARLTGQLEHPSIVPVYEVGQHADGTLYYTQRFVRGRTLRAALAECKTLGERLRLLPHFVDVCQAVAYAHDRGIIHRDLKPDNVMVGSFGETVVLDWGLARVRGDQQAEAHEAYERDEAPHPQLNSLSGTPTEQGTVMGTPAYMSPEQAEGRVDLLDERSDVFSLGIVLYELLAGQRPFSGSTAPALLAQIRKAQPRPVRELCPEVPPELAAVVERALRGDRALRTQSATELAQDLEAWQAGGKVSAYEYSSWDLLTRFVHKNRALSSVSVLLVLALGAAGAIFERGEQRARGQLAEALIWRGRAAEREQQWSHAAAFFAASRVQRDLPEARAALAIDELRVVPPLAAQRLYGLTSFALSPGGHAAVLVSVGGFYRSDELSLDPPRLMAPEKKRVPLVAVYSPDGKWIAGAGSYGGIHLWDAATFAQVGEDLGPTRGACCLAFSAGGLVAASLEDQSVRIFDLATRSEVARLARPTMTGGLAFSPDGALLAVAEDSHQISLWRAPWTEPVGRLAGHEGGVDAVVFSPDGKLLASVSSDRSLRLWDVATQQPLARLELGAPSTGPMAAAFSPDGRRLASVGPEGSALVWDVASRQRLLRVDASSGDVAAVDFARDGRLVTAGADGRLRTWDVAAALAGLGRLGAHAGTANAVLFLPGGGQLVSAGSGGLLIWDTKTHAQVGAVPGAEEAAALANAGSGELWRGGGQGSVDLIQLATGKVLRHFAGSDAPVRLVIPLEGDRIAAAAYDGRVRVWSLATGKLDYEIEADARYFERLADGRFASFARRQVSYWDSRTGKADGTVAIPATPAFNSATFSPDQHTLAVALAEGGARFFSLPSGREQRGLDGVASRAQVMLFTPDGSRLLSGGDSLTLHALPGGQPLLRRSGTEGYVKWIALSEDGTQLATCTLDGSVWLLPLGGKDQLGVPSDALARVLQRAGLQLTGVELSEPGSPEH